MQLLCSFCSKVCKNLNSKSQHERFCHTNPNKELSPFANEEVRLQIKTNKQNGLSYSNQFTKAKHLGITIGVTQQTKDNIRRKALGRKHTEETKKKMSISAMKRGIGGVAKSKRITYNGYNLGSSYELEVAKSLDENQIKWIVPKRIDYVDPFGKTRTYTADFYLPDYDVYLDPKNDFLINNINPKLGFKDTEKIELVQKQNNIRIIILDKMNLDWNSIKTKIL
jgi:hypothetical protein